MPVKDRPFDPLSHRVEAVQTRRSNNSSEIMAEANSRDDAPNVVTLRTPEPKIESAEDDSTEPRSPDGAGEPSEPASPASLNETTGVEPGRELVPVPSPSNGIGAKGRRLVARLLAAVWPSAEPTLRSNLEDALEIAGEDGFSPEERALLRNILELREQRVEDVMIPRGDIVALDMTTTLATALERFEESGHSRLPVYGDTLDDPRGMVHIRDVMDFIVRQSRGRRRKKPDGPDAPRANGSRSPAKLDLSKIDLSRTIGETKLLREVLFVPPSMPAVDLMALMQARRIQIALVIDEYGGTDGLASLEDVVEVIVGDIEDEHDDAEDTIREVTAGVWEVEGRAEIDEVSAALGIGLSEDPDRDEEIDTIGGLVFTRLGRVPARNEVVQVIPGHEVQILESDARRIRRVRVSKARPRARRARRAEGGTPAAAE